MAPRRTQLLCMWTRWQRMWDKRRSKVASDRKRYCTPDVVTSESFGPGRPAMCVHSRYVDLNLSNSYTFDYKFEFEWLITDGRRIRAKRIAVRRRFSGDKEYLISSVPRERLSLDLNFKCTRNALKAYRRIGRSRSPALKSRLKKSTWKKKKKKSLGLPERERSLDSSRRSARVGTVVHEWCTSSERAPMRPPQPSSSERAAEKGRGRRGREAERSKDRQIGEEREEKRRGNDKARGTDKKS